MSNYFYLKLKDAGYNVKTNAIFTNYLSKFTAIKIDEDKCITPDTIGKILEKYDEKENVIVFYQHKSASIFKDNLTEYLKNKNSVSFKFYLFTFDFWKSISKKQFQPKNFKVFTFAYNMKHLCNFLNLKKEKTWEKNYIFKNIWCCYNESILDINMNPINKLLISGARFFRSGFGYKEREILHKLSNTNKNIISPGYNHNEINSKQFTYNKRLNSFFACFSSSVYTNNKNTHLIVLKTFEILGSGALLVMPKAEEEYISKIGLIHLKNCFLIDFNKNINYQINWILESKNRELFNKIRKEGQLHAKKNLNEYNMINEIKSIIEG